MVGEDRPRGLKYQSDKIKDMIKRNISYGLWKSPITADLIAQGIIGLSEVSLDNDNLYWLEMRPKENGRYVLVQKAKTGKIFDVLPKKFNIRTKVHEYGGGAYIVNNDIIYFVNYSDQKIYQYSLKSSKIKKITNKTNLRYADLIIDHKNKRILSVREDHRKNNKVINAIVAICLDGSGKEDILVKGDDFYSSPRLSPDGKSLAWIAWNQPNMPWDNTSLMLADLDDKGELLNIKKISGNNEAICQPQWSPEGILYFVSDRDNWWNLYRYGNGDIQKIIEGEVELASASWVFKLSNYSFLSEHKIICACNNKGIWSLAEIDINNKKISYIDSEYSDIKYVAINKKNVFFIGGGPRQVYSVIKFSKGRNKFEIIRSSSSLKINKGYLTYPESMEFTTDDNSLAYAFYYPPKNKDYILRQQNKPPLLVISHGGPTSATNTVLNFNIQYWTSRGIAVVDVNYRGSTGYGRQYRQALYSNWGIFDWKDCINAAQYLIVRGKVDSSRLAIRGGSAGGYTTLCALTFSDFFKAGASYYGISDLRGLVKDTHKFESHYLDLLIGKYPREKNIYYQRSPLNYVDKISVPIIFFQGLEDKVVPVSQAQQMIQALKNKGLPVEYLFFSGEQHGFRKAKNIKRALEAEKNFYANIFT